MILNKAAAVSSLKICFPKTQNVVAVSLLSAMFLLSSCGEMNPHNVDVELEKSAPVEKITSCCFGGDALDELYITSASIGLDPGSIEVQPSAGAVFKVRPGVAGLPAIPFAGR